MQRKIIIAIILTVVIISTGVWIIGHLIVDESIDHSLNDRLTLAGIIAKNIDLLLERNLNRLYDISLSGKIDLGDNDWGPEKEALRAAYQYSIFTDGIFLLDRKGNVVQAYPQRLNSSVTLMSMPYVSSIINEGRPAISDIYTVEPKKKKVIYAMVPLRSKEGNIVGVAGGEIDPTNLRFNEIIKSVTAESNTYSRSVHGGALILEHNEDVPICSDCHNAHDITDPRTTDFHNAVPQLCGNCHANKVLTKKYGISPDVLDSYLQDFHGITLKFYKQGGKSAKPIAVCTDCHGIHDIAKLSSPNSPNIKANLVKRCQKCHADATANFPDSWISHYKPDIRKAPLVYMINLGYRIFIPFMIIGLLLQILLHIWRYAANR